ncbi:DUF4328 domain-containing protein [Planotetraspora sp. A-T 1434]|uniref:DUF4328 domain-containing protein n=1 Tax=Planotetraspora sp. A-T 1434 TaxID=2979219 RepID=UPI0021BFAB3E|nr:DUF4328 domain-containing protein [Planotetraspora sp. A-T 1434]MCT9933868.1 DUF4328 domain-containing protein [Planotetraspora sp. A-T 1434]
MRSAVSRAAVAVYVCLTAQAVSMGALAVFEEVRGRRLAHQIAAFGGDPHAPGARQVVGAVTVFAIVMMAVAATTAAAAVAYVVWSRRLRQAPHGQYSGSGLGLAAAWLVPGVNLVVPPLLVDRAWRELAGERPARDARSRARWLVLLTCWWLSWLVALFLVFVRPAHSGRDLTGVGLTDLAATVVAAILCAATVRELTALSEAPHRQAPHRPVVGPELPELACQSRRWSSRGGPMSE